MSTDPVPVPEAAVEAAKKAYAEAESSPKLIPCERCKGVGYHHGFGEQGHDPDWCLDCGGGGLALAAGEEDRPLRSALTAALPHLGWREDMENAPRDGTPILAWCDHEADPYIEDEASGRLTLYAAHAEGTSHAPTGFHILEWGGAFDDSTWEYPNQASLPDWWFVCGSEFEVAANPIRWQPLRPPSSKEDRT